MARLRRPAFLRRAWWRENWRENPLLWAELRRTLRSPWLTLLVVAMFTAVVLERSDPIYTGVYALEIRIRTTPDLSLQEQRVLRDQIRAEWGEFWFDALGVARDIARPVWPACLGLLIGLAWRRDRTLTHREGLVLTGQTHGQIVVARGLVWAVPVGVLLVLLMLGSWFLKAATWMMPVARAGRLFLEDGLWLSLGFQFVKFIGGALGTLLAVFGLAIFASLRGAPALLVAALCALVGLNSLLFHELLTSFPHQGLPMWFRWFLSLMYNWSIITFAILFWWLAMREVRRKYPI